MRLKKMFEAKFDFSDDPDFEEWFPSAVTALVGRGLLGPNDEVSEELIQQMKQACDEGEAVEDFVDSIDSQRGAPPPPPEDGWGAPTKVIPDDDEEGIPMHKMAHLDKLMRGESIVREAHGEREAGKSNKMSRANRQSFRADAFGRPENPPEVDDFGDEPPDEDGFTDKDMSYLTGGGNPDRGSFDKKGGFHAGDDEEFKGAPADPMLAGFGDTPDDSTFGDDPVFGDIPEPSADPEDDLWHGAPPWDPDETGASGGQHHTNVTFPDYEGPEAKSSWDSGEPDEKGFYPRSKRKSKRG